MKINKNLFSVLIIFIVLLLPLYNVYAGDFLADLTSGIFRQIPLLIINILCYVSTYILGATIGLLSWVTGPNFITMGAADVTEGSATYNFIVAMGWGIVRNLANAALIIGLVYIAINIILGNEEKSIRDTLIRFIIIALLINFTPVICSFIIDSSNIVMNSFLTGGSGSNYANQISTAFNTTVNSAIKLEGKELFNVLATGLVITIFSLIASVIYTLYSALFIIRHIFLWILVILSPIAFATKVFPNSKYITKIFPSITYWDEWWNQFIQWCVVGIPAGFFMYLSNQLMVAIAQNGGTIVPTSSVSGVPAVLQGIFPYLIPLAFLIVGFFITISAGQQAASGTVGGGALGAAIGGALGAATTGLATRLGGGALSRIGGAGDWAKEGTIGTAGALLKGEGTKAFGFGNEGFKAREGGRQAVSDWKTRTKEKIAEMPVAGRLINAPDPEKANQHEYDKYNKLWNFDQRKKAETRLSKENSADFLDGAVDKTKSAKENSAEYQRRLDSISANGSDKVKLDGYLHASGNINLIGGPAAAPAALNNYLAKSKIDDVGTSIRKMSAKDARERITPEGLENNPIILKNLGPKQGANIMKDGSEEQRRVLKNKTVGNANFNNYILGEAAIMHNPASDPDEINKAKANVERALRLINEVVKNS
jgi:hypothetical protein